MVGYTDEELKKLTPLDITPVDDREINRVLFRELQQGKRHHFELVKPLKRKDGKIIWIQLYVFGIPDAEGIGQRTFGMVFDITEKMQVQDELQAAQAELARSMQMSRMGAMAASIAHEINQPLTAMIGSAGAGLRWLAQTPPNFDEATENFKQIARDGQRAADVVEGNRAMFQSGETSHGLLDVNEVIDEVLGLTNGELKRREIIVHTQLEEKLAPVKASRVQLQWGGAGHGGRFRQRRRSAEYGPNFWSILHYQVGEYGDGLVDLPFDHRVTWRALVGYTRQPLWSRLSVHSSRGRG